MANLKSNGFRKTSLDYFEHIDKQFTNVENVADSVVNYVNNNNLEIFIALRMFEFEKQDEVGSG